MTDTPSLAEAVAALSPWEGAAVVLGIAYLVLAARGNILCWACAAVSTTIYIVLFWNVNLLMESALNVYYLAMAGYGWWQWRSGGQAGGALEISSWVAGRHVGVVAAVLLLSALSGWLLSQYSDAAWPYIDSFTTWGAIVTTWMVARKILENWLYWLVIDAVCIPVYIDRGLYLTAALFAAYLVIVIIGYWSWYREYHGPGREPSPA